MFDRKAPDYEEIASRYNDKKVTFEREHFTVTRIPKSTKSYDADFALVEKSYLKQLKGEADTLLDKYGKAQDEIEALGDALNNYIDAMIECQYGKAQRDETIEHQDTMAFWNKIIDGGKTLVMATACGVLLY